MACQAIHTWTFVGLVGAFVNLTIAYLLLCASAVVYMASKFLGFLGLSLPCPCNGLQTLLVDSPRKTVSSVMVSVKRSSPFNSIYQEDYSLNLRLISDGKSEMVGGDEIEEDSIAPMEITEISADSSYNFTSTEIGSCWDHKELHAKSTMEENSEYSCEEEEEGEEEEKEKIRNLKRALEEERASRAALYVELEKERIAASTAADEAMAMIFRLQEEKALREMEARQYRRMVEEKSAYEEEEMRILKEIILAREREKLFLEKEVEAYREAATTEIHESF